MWVIYIIPGSNGKGQNEQNILIFQFPIYLEPNSQLPSRNISIYIYINIYISGNNRKLVPNIFGELEEGRIFTLAAPSLKKNQIPSSWRIRAICFSQAKICFGGRIISEKSMPGSKWMCI